MKAPKIVSPNFVVAMVVVAASSVLLAGCNNTPKHDEEPSRQAAAPQVETAPVREMDLKRDMSLRAELTAYQDVALYSKVEGFIKSISVDRGSNVRKGQPIIVVSAPELDAQVAEAAAKVEKAKSALMQARGKLASAQANVKEGEARTAADRDTYERYKKAAQKPGVIAEGELAVAANKVDGDEEHVRSLKAAVDSAKSEVAAAQSEVAATNRAAEAVAAMKNYADIRAPFDGVITERNVHEGSLVSPRETGAPLVRCQELSKLRLTVPVPEIGVGGLKLGTEVRFSVPAYPNKTFVARVSRLGHALDQSTRSMPVELDVANDSGELEPGMCAEVQWQVERPYRTTFVPATSVGRSLSQNYVDLVSANTITVVPVKTGQSMGDLIEIFADIPAESKVLTHPSEEWKTGAKIQN